MWVTRFTHDCDVYVTEPICGLTVQGYNGAAVGKGRQLAKTELEKLKLSELTTREAVFEAARMWVQWCSLIYRF
jgi:20S proteasome alpha/beta subunit